MSELDFETHNKRDGKQKTCKFCHQPVWWHIWKARWYDPGGETLHVESCPLRKKHFHDKGLDSAESRRHSQGDML